MHEIQHVEWQEVDKNVDIEPNDGMKEPHKEETYGYAYAW